jgi:hypothetical protein
MTDPLERTRGIDLPGTVDNSGSTRFRDLATYVLFRDVCVYQLVDAKWAPFMI